MEEINAPTLLLNEQICRSNIQKMADKAQKHELLFKPHMKTHQSAKIGEWFKDFGIEAITVSSVSMAEYFSNHGWNDITIAFPCNIRQIDRINELATSIDLTLLVNNLTTLNRLGEKLTQQVKAYIEIDTGSNRTGLKVTQVDQIKNLITAFKKYERLNWIGLYSHPGHSYKARSVEEIQEIQQSVCSKFKQLREQLSRFLPFQVCVGDTPCCSQANAFDGIDAVSPGNFVFYDLMQVQIGSCAQKDIAVAVVCPVVDQYPDRNELAIHGGAVHFSKETMTENGITHYGKICSKKNDHWKIRDKHSYLRSLSQEHGIVKCSDSVFGSYQVGDLVTVLPVHSCLTANLMKQYKLADGRIINQYAP